MMDVKYDDTIIRFYDKRSNFFSKAMFDYRLPALSINRPMKNAWEEQA